MIEIMDSPGEMSLKFSQSLQRQMKPVLGPTLDIQRQQQLEMERLKTDLSDLKAENGNKVESSMFDRMARQMVEIETKVAELQKDNHLANLKN